MNERKRQLEAGVHHVTAEHAPDPFERDCVVGVDTSDRVVMICAVPEHLTPAAVIEAVAIILDQVDPEVREAVARRRGPRGGDGRDWDA